MLHLLDERYEMKVTALCLLLLLLEKYNHKFYLILVVAQTSSIWFMVTLSVVDRNRLDNEQVLFFEKKYFVAIMYQIGQ